MRSLSLAAAAPAALLAGPRERRAVRRSSVRPNRGDANEALRGVIEEVRLVPEAAGFRSSWPTISRAFWC
jgi:hypothetical protein